MRRFSSALLLVAAVAAAPGQAAAREPAVEANFHPGQRLLEPGAPDLELALGLLRDGLPGAAVAPLDGHLAGHGPGPLTRASFLLGLSLLESGQAEPAACWLAESAEGLHPALEGYRQHLLGEALFRAGRRLRAEAALARAAALLPAGAPERAAALKRRADCLHALGAPERALALLSGARLSLPRGYLPYLRGVAAFEQGRARGAAEALRQALVRGRDAAFVRDAEARLGRLEALGVAAARLTRAERIERIRSLLDARLPDEAERRLQDLSGEAAAGFPARFQSARVALVRRDYSRAVELFGRLAREFASQPEQAALAGRKRAKALAYGGELEQARTANQEVARSYPGTKAGRIAGYYSGYLAMFLGDWKTGARLFTNVLSRRPSASRRRNAFWYLAWCRIRLGQQEEALAALRPLAKSRHKLDRGAAAYWTARVLDQGSQRKPAIKAYRSVLERFPGSYYAALARQRLRDLGITLAALMEVPEHHEDPQVPARVPRAVQRNVDRAVLLARHGLFRAAARRLDAPELALRSQPGAALALADLARRLGDEQRAYRFAARAGTEERRRAPTPQTLALWRAAYPRSYRGVIEAAAARHGCDESLLYAVMRQESAFDQRAVSRVGARGLLQLMPETGARIARARKIEDHHPDWLFQPESNADAAAWYLAALSRKFDGNLALVAAAYNGGLPNVEHWLARLGGGELDLFVEEIPFDETRGYVKKVLSAYAVYRLLYYGDRDPLQDLPRKVEAEYPGGVDF